MMPRTYLLVAAALTLITLATVRADDYITLDPGELKASPQAFWARGVVFSDVVESVGGTPIKLDGKQYSPLQTRVLGVCYLDPAMEGDAASLQTGREYAFSGSVYQKDAGFFSAKRQFYVIIKRATAAASAANLSTKNLGDLARAAGAAHAKPLHDLDTILSQAMRDLQAYCASSNIAMAAIFEPNSRHAPRLTQAVRQAIYSYENQNKIPAVEYMVSLLTSLMVAQQAAPESTVVPTPALQPEPAPAPDVVAEPAPEPEIVEPSVLEPPVVEPTVVEPTSDEPVAEPVMEATPEELLAPIAEETTQPEPTVDVASPVEPEPALAAEPMLDEPASVETMPEPVPEPATATEVVEPAPESVIVEPVVTEPVVDMPRRRSSTLPAAQIKLPTPKLETPAPAEEKPAEAKPTPKKAKKAKEEDKPEPVAPAKKPSLLDLDPNAPVPLR